MAVIKTIVFWQPIVSPHYSSLFRALCSYYKVFLLVERISSEERRQQGWQVPHLGEVEVQIIDRRRFRSQFALVDSDETLHIFSGTRGYRVIWKVFQHAIRVNAHSAFMAETIDWIGFKGRLRYLVGVADRILYLKKVKFILAIGRLGTECYRRMGYRTNRIFEWGYFVEPSVFSEVSKSVNSHPKFAFVGRISKEKGLEWLVQELCNLNEFQFELHVIGDGPESKRIQASIPAGIADRFKFYGRMVRDEIDSLLRNMDYLVLPSIGKDGWGSVVNEALALGVPCIVSTYAGASVLVSNENFSFTINPDDSRSLGRVLLHILEHKATVSFEKRCAIKRYSQKVSAAAGAGYLKDVIDFFFEPQQDVAPESPWRSHGLPGRS